MKRALAFLVALAAMASSASAGASQSSDAAAHAPAGSAHGLHSPSCPLMPTNPPSGYRITVSDNFQGTSINAHKWFEWSGQPGGDPNGWWSPTQDVVTGSMLQFRGDHVAHGGNPRWTHGGEVTGGIGSIHSQVYGEYEWCMKDGDSPGTKTAALLWPADNTWPPEVDFFESWGDPFFYCMWLHYGIANHKVLRRIYYQYSAHWTVYLAVWRPGNLQMLENGRQVANIASPYVPAVPMRFDLETMATTPDAVVGTTDVMWIIEFAPLTSKG